MKIKLNSKSILSILFVLFITISGVLSILTNPVKIFGGLARGYMNSPEESSVFEKIGNSLNLFDQRMSEYYILHDPSIHAYGCIQKFLGRTLIHDVDPEYEVVKLENGYLTFKEDFYADYTALKDYLIELESVCDSCDSKLLYVSKCSKTPVSKDLQPPFYPYSYTSNFNDIKPILETNNIQVLDLENLITKNNIDKYDLFYKTDHHWTPQAGLWVSKNICSTINDTYDWEIDINTFDAENYNTKRYPNSFLGSQGKRTGMLYAGTDNFDVVTPEFQTSLTVSIDDISFYETGDFYQTLIHEENITPEKLLNQEGTAYQTYMQGNHSLVKIENHNIRDGKKALIVMDSYGCVVAPYLALAFERVDCIDIRSYTDSLENYIRSTSPDVVIYMISSHQQ